MKGLTYFNLKIKKTKKMSKMLSLFCYFYEVITKLSVFIFHLISENLNETLDHTTQKILKSHIGNMLQIDFPEF